MPASNLQELRKTDLHRLRSPHRTSAGRCRARGTLSVPQKQRQVSDRTRPVWRVARFRTFQIRWAEAVKLTVGSAGGVASRVLLGEHQLIFDQPSSVAGGRDLGPSPLDVLAATVGACAHYFAAAFLSARKISVDELRVEVEAEKVREPQPRFGRFSLRVLVPHDVPESYLPQIERVVRNCPAYGTLVHPPEVELAFVKLEARAPAA